MDKLNILNELIAGNQEAMTLAMRHHEAHASIAYLHDAQRNMYRFAMVSTDHVAASLFVGSEMRYKRISPMIKADVDWHNEMMEYYLPHFKKRCPDGWLTNNPTCAVFELTYDQAASCLNMLNPLLEHRLKKTERIAINEYYDHCDETTPYTMRLQIEYERCCRNLIEHFINANVELANSRVSKLIQSLEDTIINLREEKRKLLEALDLAAQSPNYLQVKTQVEANCLKRYAFLEASAMKSLIEGELIYHTLSIAGACHDSAIVSYSKIVEIQLKKHLQEKHPQAVYDGITLGAIIHAIRDNCVAPYYKSFDIYMDINAKRVMAVHAKTQRDCQITEETVEELRHILFDLKVLDYLR